MGALVGLVVAAWSVVLLAWLILHWGILPNADRWRPQIEAHASRALGVPVTVGAIRVPSSSWVPALELADVVLHDGDGRPALQLPRVAAALSVHSLLALQLRFEQLLIEAPELEVRRDALGRLHVAGLELSGNASATGEDRAAADWFFQQHEFVVRGGRVRWIDEWRLAPPLELQDVDLVLRNSLRRHAVRLDATPPPGWGERFSLQGRFTQPLLAPAGDLRRWTGTLHASLPRADVGQLRRHVELPFELHEGDGAARAWVDIERGRVRSATVDLALRSVDLRLASHVDPLALQQVRGRLSYERTAEGLTLAARGFTFATTDGDAWPEGDLTLGLRQRRDDGDGPQPVEGGELQAAQLDLALMHRLAGGIPFGDAVQRLLDDLSPEGELRGLQARWDGPLDQPRHYQVRGRLEGLAIAPRPAAEPGALGRPGWRGATLELDANEGGGSGQLSLDGGSLVLPGLWELPEVGFDRFSARFAWRIDAAKAAASAPSIEVKVQDARFENTDAQGGFEATWHTGAGTGFGRGGRYPGVLDLKGTLARGRGEAVARYLPADLRDTRSYLTRAVQGGRLSAGSFRLKGDLWAFPFHQATEGEFRIAAQVDDGTFAYVPSEPGWTSPWPAFTQVQGELLFDRTSMTIRNARARLWGVELNGVSADIDNLNAASPVLRVDGRAQGPLQDMVRYVNSSPVGGWSGNTLREAQASGPADLKLALRLPLADLERSTVQGSVTLAHNDVRLMPGVPLLGAARGRVDFSHQGFAIVGGAARVLGGDATFEGGTQPDGSLRFSGQGVATADGLRRATEIPTLGKAAQALSGQAGYRLTLGFVRGHLELGVTSSLAGMAIDLPAPLRKAPEATLPLRWQTSVTGDDQAPREQLKLELGTVLQAHYERELSKPSAPVLRGAVGINGPATLPASGVTAHIEVATLETAAWKAVATRWLADAPGGAPGGGGAAAELGGYLPHSIALQAGELVAEGRRLSGVVAGLSLDPDGSAWRANVEADQLGGFVEWRPGTGAGTPGRVLARLSRLSLPPAEAERVENLLAQAPASVPALDVVVDRFELRGKQLGRLEIAAVNRLGPDLPRDGARDWHLERLSLRNPEAELTATGDWRASGPGGRRRMVMDFRLDLADSGDLLERLGTGRAIEGGKGRLDGELSWSGSPLGFDIPSMDGRFTVNLEKGQFLKADAGAARLLSVLSLQTLPRRLVLDFRDVFEEGFPFDQVQGDVTVSGGVASTNNLRLRGTQAAVLMEGSADLQRETQDLRVLVVPEINAGTASLAYAAINPAVGLGTFLAQMFLRRPLMAAGTREFHVSGPWADPKVERVERKPGQPLPDLDPPAAAASSAPRSP